MMKKILILEDNLYTAEDMIEDIRYELNADEQHIDAIIANSIDEANDKLANIRDEELLCTIADLNMNPEGLTSDQRRETQGAVLTGWVWIYSCLWGRENLKAKPIIFYSAFISQLSQNEKYLALKSEEKRKITLISKNESGISNLCDTLVQIIKRSGNR